MSDDAVLGSDLGLTPLESDILGRYYRAYFDKGFPAVSELQVTSRENTGAGRYTSFWHDRPVDLPDGWHGVGSYCQIEMENLPSGACYVLLVERQKVKFLEIAVNGNYDWDGVERHWLILDAETGEAPAKD